MSGAFTYMAGNPQVHIWSVMTPRFLPLYINLWRAVIWGASGWDNDWLTWEMWKGIWRFYLVTLHPYNHWLWVGYACPHQHGPPHPPHVEGMRPGIIEKKGEYSMAAPIFSCLLRLRVWYEFWGAPCKLEFFCFFLCEIVGRQGGMIFFYMHNKSDLEKKAVISHFPSSFSHFASNTMEIPLSLMLLDEGLVCILEDLIALITK